MPKNAQHVPQGNHRGAHFKARQIIVPSGRAQQRDAISRADGQQAAARARRRGNELPLAEGYVGVHAQDRKHHRHVVDDGRRYADQRVGEGGAEVGIKGP